MTDVAGRTGGSEIRGSLGISRLGRQDGDDSDKRIVALADIDRITVAEARRFVPYVLQPRLYEWLTQTPMDGVMSDEATFEVTDGVCLFMPLVIR